jgi:two-component system phosphate regulon sensor histidine kinase PhoR
VNSKWGVGERLFLAHFLLTLVALLLFLFAPWTKGHPWLALGGLVWIGSLGFYFAHSAGDSMRRLQEAARSIAAGDGRVPRIPRGPGELADVAASLELVSSKLTSQIGNLTAERDLREAVLAGMREAVLVLRPDARILLFNRAAKELFGFSDQAEEQPLVELLRFPTLLDAVYDATRGRPAPIDLVIPGPPRRELVGQATPLPKGREAAVLISVRDVTELRRLEAMRRDFVANASHELRTPVATIRGYAETLEEGALEDPVAAKRFVAGLSRQAARLSDLIDDLLDLSRLESGSPRLAPSANAMGAILDPLVHSQREAAEAKGLSLSVTVDDETIVFAEPTAVELIVGNLLENAIKYTPPGGSVELRARREGPIVRVEVTDSGPGLDPHHLPRIFERFYRVDAGRSRDVGGTGLGLSIAKHLAQQSGGDLGVQSRPGRGSCFTLRLPAG